VATVIPFVPPLENVTYGAAEPVSPLVRRVIAENPSKYSYRGTGTYIVGRGEVAVIDPGPELESHREALVKALAGEKVVAILVTHCHSDHSPLAKWLHETTGAPRYAYGPHGPTEDPDDDPPPEPTAEEKAKEEAEVGQRETIDTDFAPDIVTPDGYTITGPGWTFDAVFTPGHTSNHTSFALREERALFSGDHVMGWSTTVVSPPDGDMRAYCASMEKVIARNDAIVWPTHGNPITDPQPYLRALLAHRLEREAQILECVGNGLHTIEVMVKLLYKDVHEGLHKAAARSVLSHLRKLVSDGAVIVGGDGRPSSNAEYRPA
jgi:glyoxylase-like metal-dependent hydrolase (beta-lactamase superfamily II)